MERQIFYYDTDAGGVVYYANYLKYMEEARTEYILNCGLKRDEFLFAVRKCSLMYRSPARYGDTIICTSDIVKMTAAQIIFDQKIYDKSDNRLLVEGEVTIVALSKDFKPVVIPEEIKEKLKK